MCKTNCVENKDSCTQTEEFDQAKASWYVNVLCHCKDDFKKVKKGSKIFCSRKLSK